MEVKSLTKEIGQLFITGLKGTSLTNEESKFIKENNIGGIIIFKHNYEDPAQLTEMINEIQSLRDEYPLFISVDHEGGRVHRFSSHFTHFPSMLELGRLDSPKLIYEVYQWMGKELSACGINLNFAPCCDVLLNPQNKVIGDRAFGTTTDEVIKHVSAAIRGLQSENVIACGKHFPGHGGTKKDSHFDLPYVKTSLEDIERYEIPPFVKASKSRLEFMLMAHLVVDAIDPDLPTTMSAKAYQYLRSATKFSKIIITDDLDMKAIADRFSVRESASLALQAGADMVIHRDFDNTAQAYQFLREQVAANKINKSEFSDKLARVYRCKKQFLSGYQPVYIPKISKAFHSPEKEKFLSELDGKLKSLG